MATNFDIPVSLKVRLIAEQLIKIGGETYSVSCNDISSDDENHSYWSGVNRYEIWIDHLNKSLDVLLFDHGYASYEIDQLLLIVSFDLDSLYPDTVATGESLLKKIKTSILVGIQEFQKQRPDQQLKLFETKEV
ncbi:hypothetical protein [Crocosphaera sp.]|uniref:hypothetical protein n=1 Tax=Crocosphaera sp. TaxID=2729996 RepID=UPI0026086FFA|nr:hypothetical protein [Crocosphaera sp.]MDJ0579032.1 hypothetical protein [Crocosphaera sp.]